MDNKQYLISEYCKITGVAAERAERDLAAAKWDYSMAVSKYFEEGERESDDETFKVHPPPAKKREQEKTSSGPSRFATMSSLMQNEDKSDEEEGQAFYAGGSDRSGQQVLGPGKHKKGNIVRELFQSAKRHGAEVIDPNEAQSGSQQLRVFHGTGHVLGATAESADSEPTTRKSPRSSGSGSTPDEGFNIHFRGWRSGFTVDNGPLREYHDPRNRDFLDSIRAGNVPRELVKLSKGCEVSLNIEDRSHEDYVQPVGTSAAAFTGQGHRLGSPTPKIESAVPKNEEEQNEQDAKEKLNLDLSKPTTTVQIRLANGERLLVTVNCTNTIGDLRQYIVTARPEYGSQIFHLKSMYPANVLEDDHATVSEANVLNSVIVQYF